MNHSFHSADKATYRKTIFVALLSCAVLFGISIFIKPPQDKRFLVVRADKSTRTAGQMAQGVQR